MAEDKQAKLRESVENIKKLTTDTSEGGQLGAGEDIMGLMQWLSETFGSDFFQPKGKTEDEKARILYDTEEPPAAD